MCRKITVLKSEFLSWMTRTCGDGLPEGGCNSSRLLAAVWGSGFRFVETRTEAQADDVIARR